MQQRDGEGWKTKTNWSSVVVHSEHLRKRLGGSAGRAGNLVAIDGFIRNSAEKGDGEDGSRTTVYRTDLVATDMEVLHFAARKESAE